jgi:TPR repeat protein
MRCDLRERRSLYMFEFRMNAATCKFLCLTVIGMFFMLTMAACSVTPGDAARRGGHYPQAACQYEVVASHGDPLAARKLANLYDQRPGLPEDHAKAVYWYDRAIELGDIPSYWYAGVIYHDGKGNVPRDYGLAEEYFLRGAEEGHHLSIYDLADMYAENLTGTPDDIEGLKWFNIVTYFAIGYSKTDEEAQYILRDPKRIRAKLTARMSPGEIKKAEKLADAWLRDWMRRKE